MVDGMVAMALGLPHYIYHITYTVYIYKHIYILSIGDVMEILWGYSWSCSGIPEKCRYIGVQLWWTNQMETIWDNTGKIKGNTMGIWNILEISWNIYMSLKRFRITFWRFAINPYLSRTVFYQRRCQVKPDGVPRIHIILGGSHLTGSFLRAECKFPSLRIECIVVYLCLHVRRTRMK